MLRLFTVTFIVLIISSSAVFSANQVKIYIPADSIHGEQELRVGHPGDIYVEFTNDKPIREIKIKFAVSNFTTGDSLWNSVSSSDNEFLLSSKYFLYKYFYTTQQDNIWPDTITYSLSASNNGIQYPPPDSYTLAKFTVTPHTTGTMQFIPIEVTFRDATNNLITPQFISASMEVISDYDCNNNGVEDYLDINDGTSYDCNENLIPDECEEINDCNNNGIDDACESLNDCNENGIPDYCETFTDCNNNGIPDECDFDCNFNGIPDECETMIDCNCNGIPDADDIASGYVKDTNGNGVPDNCDNMPNDYYRVIVPPNEFHGPQKMLVGFEEEIYVIAHTNLVVDAAVVYAEFKWSSGVDLWNYVEGIHLQPETFDFIRGINYFDENNSSPDTLEGYGLTLIAPFQSPGDYMFIKLKVIPTDTGTVVVTNSRSHVTSDSSLFQLNNGPVMYIPLFADDIKILKFPDCNNNMILDSIDIVNNILNDCNNNFIADACEVDDYPDSDCNNNNQVDVCELESNPSLDCNGNGIIDICDINADPSLDCNQNGKIDLCEIDDDPSLDCNMNAILDACDIANDPSLDCNLNGSIDICDIMSGISEDCNANLLPDECDVDCNLNGMPDDCESITDCNCNAVDDAIDIASGWSDDSDGNSIPDDCEGKAGSYIRVYAQNPDGSPSYELQVNTECELIFALTSASAINGFTIPFSPISSDNSRLWDILLEENVEYLEKEDMRYIGITSFEKQYLQWPDSLLLNATRFSTSPPFPANNTMPIIRLKVMPTQEGIISLQPIHIPPGSDFSYTNMSDGLVYPLGFKAEPFSIGCCRVMRGNIDYDSNNNIDISDLVYMVQYQFGNPTGPAPYCFKEADVDNSGDIDISDLVTLVAFQFLNGIPPHACQD